MAIEIIQRGTKPSEITYETHCLTCKSILRYKSPDITFNKTLNLSGFKCPVCGRFVPHSEHFRISLKITEHTDD